MTPVEAWARAFALTVAVELAVAPLLLRPGEASLARRLATVLVAQLASHPVVWFVLPELALRRTAFLAVAEGWAVLSELVVYHLVFTGLGTSRAAATSLIANGASFGAGLVLGSALGLR